MTHPSCSACPARRQSAVCDLPPGVLEDLHQAGVPVRYRPRQVLFDEGTPAMALYLLCRGAVKLYHADRFGRGHILDVARPGALIGELGIGDGGMSVSAEALTDVQASRFSPEQLRGFLRRHPEAGMGLLGGLSRELAVARRKSRDLALKGALSRLAALLVGLEPVGDGGANGARLGLRYTRRELAEMIGVTTETTVRLLAALKRTGAVRSDKRDLIIVDRARLRRLAESDETGERAAAD